MPRDPNTNANYDSWRTIHTVAELAIDFKQQKLVGTVTLELEALSETSSESTIILDTSFLDIKSILLDGTKTIDWTVAERKEPYGSPLTIKVPSGKPKSTVVKLAISLSTTVECTALQWLTPEQTKSKHPYMFSQCQAIHNRSLFPCQDTPDVKSTYEFLITSPLPVVASGVAVTAGKAVPAAVDGSKLYHFIQNIPMPSYLFALASGDITTAEIGPRSKVATGPTELAAAKWELENDMEHFMEIAEKLVLPYVWGEYNVLVLPASFPYGGMENPVYTFATPTIISGDRENIDVIAHELSHSWSGNLVSNGSWEHFWLNEGWTTYLERRIVAAVHGEPHRDFSAIIGWKALEDSVNNFGADHEFTKLIINLKGRDPDDAFSSIPYEKGFHFLYYLEKLITKPVFDTFIPHYFSTWQQKSLDSFEFKATLLDFFAKDQTVSKALAEVDWDSWFYQPGLPPKPKFDTSLVDKCYILADKWQSKSEDFTPSPEDTASWSANQIVVFLETLLSSPASLSAAQTSLLGSMYKLTATQNVELSSRYFQLGLRARDKSVYQPTATLLGQVGRMKFVRPLYAALFKVDRDFALSTFEKNKAFYHPICRGMVEKDLEKKE